MLSLAAGSPLFTCGNAYNVMLTLSVLAAACFSLAVSLG